MELLADGIDEGEMSRTTRYCEANKFYWSGVIKDKVNIRQWIFEQAGYILCDTASKVASSSSSRASRRFPITGFTTMTNAAKSIRRA